MKSNTKAKIIILITLGIFFALSPIINNSFNFNEGNSDDSNLENKNLQISAVSGKIHIDNNWTDAKVAGICTGSGTYPDPYIIEDLVVDSGGPGTCITIENSDVYFKIENCTLYNTGAIYVGDGGIKLNDVTNGIITNNTCSSNYNGIYIGDSENNTISGNIANNNDDNGIYLWYSKNNTVSGNTIYDNEDDGIYIYDNCDNIRVSGNTINDNGEDGINLWLCNNNTISGNSINNNTLAGIYLRSSNNNQVSGNILLGNNICILEENSQGNEFSDNGACTYGQDEDGGIPIELIIIISVISGGAVIGVATLLLIRRKRKRIE